MLPLADRPDDVEGVRDREGVVADEAADRVPHVIHLRHLGKKRDEVEQSPVVRVIVPRQDGEALLGLEHVGSGGVVDDDGILAIAADLRHVFREYAVDEGAVLAEESRRCESLRVHHVHQRVRILSTATRVSTSS